MTQQSDRRRAQVETGETVFNDDGRPVGLVTSTAEDGFEVGTETVDGSGETDQEELPGQEFGEGYLMWRCGDCGEMGQLEDGFPPECPNCGAPGEEISEVQED